MRRIKNKGFIATSILFGIVALLFITFAILMGNSKASLKSDRLYGYMLKSEITNMSGIRLNPNGGTIKKTLLEIDFNGKYEGLPAVDSKDEPTREGYNFIGWYTAKDGGEYVDEGTEYSKYKANILYAHWSKNIYTLTVNLDGGTNNDLTGVNNIPLEFEEQLEITNPTKTGYIFEGWELTGAGSKIDGTIFQMGYADATLKAKYKVKNIILTVDPQGGTWEDELTVQTFNLEYESTKEIPNPIRDGYTFTGWDTEPNGVLSGTTFVAGATDASLTATWKLNTYPYLVKHYQQGIYNDEYTLVEADTTEGEAEFGSTVTPPSNTYAGFELFGDLIDLYITSDVNNNIAEYKYARILYKLTINPNNGSYDGPFEEYHKYGKSIVLSIPTRTGYTFKNWTATSGSISDNIFTISDSDTTLTANWNANEYILTLNSTGGAVTTPQIKVKYDDKYGELETPIRTGYTFKGWSTTSDGKNIINDDTIVKTASDHTLYAVWEANQYTVTLNLRGGTASTTSINVTYDGKYDKLPTPTRDKYTFYGWFTDPTGGVQVSTSTNVTTVGNHDLYARWLPNDASVIQYSNPSYTTCTNVACTLNELYQLFK